MHIILLIIGVLAGAAFWWYRLRMARDAMGEAVDAVGRVRGKLRRRKISNQNRLSPLTAIGDPIVAGATVLVAVASEDVPLSDTREEAIRIELAQIAEADKVEEAMIYAKWANGQIDDAPLVVDKIAPFLAERLYENEKHALLVMARTAVEADGPELASSVHRLRRLRQKLGLELD